MPDLSSSACLGWFAFVAFQMTAAEHPEDDEVCAALRRCASSVESGGARSQALLARLKEELARQNQPHADERWVL